MIVRELVATLGLDFVGEGFDQAKEAFEHLEHSIMGVGAVFAAAFVGLAGITLEVAEHAEKVGLLSEELGIGVEALQEYGYAAQLHGVDIDSFGKSLQFLQKNMALANEGNQQMADAFANNGISIHDAQGKIVPVNEALLRLADRMQKITDPAKRVRLAMQVMGKAGAQMIPALLKGREGLEEIAKAARESGGVMSEEFITSSRELIEKMKEAKLMAFGFAVTLAQKFMPILSKLVGWFNEWYKAHQKIIKLIASSLVKAFASTLEVAARGVVFLVEGLLRLADYLESIFPGFKKIAIAAGVFAAALASPLVAILAISAAIILLTDDIKVWVEGGDSMIGRLIGRFDDLRAAVEDNEYIIGLKARWEEYGESIKSVLSTIGEGIATAFGLGFLFHWRDTMDQIVGLLEKAGGLIKKLAGFMGVQMENSMVLQGVGSFIKGGGDQYSAANVAKYGGSGALLADSAGAAPPGVSGVGNVNMSPVNNITIHAATNDPHKIAATVRDALEQFHGTKMQEAMAHTTPGVAIGPGGQ